MTVGLSTYTLSLIHIYKAMRVLSSLDVDMCNLHAGGTRRMMEAAVEGLTRADGTRPLLILSLIHI